MRKTQEEKDLEYFEKMRDSIIRDIENWRNISAIMWSINRRWDWWKNKLESIIDEYAYNESILSWYETNL